MIGAVSPGVTLKRKPGGELELSWSIEIAQNLPKAVHDARIARAGSGIPEDVGIAKLNIVGQVVSEYLELQVLVLGDANIFGQRKVPVAPAIGAHT
jgi:hypothetical protein